MSADRAAVGVETAEPSDLSPTTVDDGLPPAQMERLARGVTEHLLVDDVTPETDETGLAHVYSEQGKQYTVDVETGACTCPDAEHNLNLDAGERCKHTYRAEVTDEPRPVAVPVSERARLLVAALDVGHVLLRGVRRDVRPPRRRQDRRTAEGDGMTDDDDGP